MRKLANYRANYVQNIVILVKTPLATGQKPALYFCLHRDGLEALHACYNVTNVYSRTSIISPSRLVTCAHVMMPCIIILHVNMSDSF